MTNLFLDAVDAVRSMPWTVWAVMIVGLLLAGAMFGYLIWGQRDYRRRVERWRDLERE